MMSKKTNVNSILIFPSSSSSLSRTALLLLYNYLFLFLFPFVAMFFLEVGAGGTKSSYDYHFACWGAYNSLLTRDDESNRKAI